MRVVAVLGLLLELILPAGCAPASGTGRVNFQLAAEIRDSAGPASLQIVVQAVGVHVAGRPIETGWITWQPERSHVDLATLGPDGTVPLGAGNVPAGRYDRVRIVVEAGQAQTKSGIRVPLTLNVEPIAIPFELEDQDQVAITIEIIALPQADGGYHLFTRSATMSGGQ